MTSVYYRSTAIIRLQNPEVKEEIAKEINKRVAEANESPIASKSIKFMTETNEELMAERSCEFTTEKVSKIMIGLNKTCAEKADKCSAKANDKHKSSVQNMFKTRASSTFLAEVNDSAIAEVPNDIFAAEAKDSHMTGLSEDAFAAKADMTEMRDVFASKAKFTFAKGVNENIFAAKTKNSLITKVNDDAIVTEVKNSFMKLKIDVSAAKDSLMTAVSDDVFAAAGDDSFAAGKNITFTAKESELLDRTGLLYLQKFETSENETAEKELDPSEAFQKLCLTFLVKQQCGEEELKEDIKTLEKLSREIAYILYEVKMMQCTKSSVVCEKARELFLEVRKTYASLAQKVSKEQYFNFNKLWKSVTQHLVAQAAFLKYIESGEFLSKTEAAEILGVVEESTEGFHLDLRDYLMGVSEYPKELVHLSTRYAIRGQHEKCVDILNFIVDLKRGFKRLNLKNNQLRRSYDSLKYEIKRADTIVMELKKHGHLNSEEASLSCFDSDD